MKGQWKEQWIKRKSEGFTMAELLIVVAIIAVLVAIAVPVFNTQLEKSREGVDLANIRTAYAQVKAASLGGKDGVVYCAKVEAKQAVPEFQYVDTSQLAEIGTDSALDNFSTKSGSQKYLYIYSSDANGGAVSVATTAPSSGSSIEYVDDTE